MNKARIPSKARKLTFNDQTWHWLVGGLYGSEVLIWSPERQKYSVPKYRILGWDKAPFDWHDIPDSRQIILPGNVRKYIEEKILGNDSEFERDETAVVGKLYVYRHQDKTCGQAPVVSTNKIEPPGLKASRNFLDHIAFGKPVFLVQHWIDKQNKTWYYKVLVETYMVTLKLEWPRTWRGSFTEADPRKQYEQK